MRSRIEKLLALAVVRGYETLILGAWGCGVFRNEPDSVAAWFAEQLTGDGIYRAAFRRVVFAVSDKTPNGSTILPFRSRFEKA